MERVISFCGLFVMLGVAVAMSSARRRISLRLVGGGVALQFVLALLILKTDTGRLIFQWLGDRFRSMQSFTDAGTGMIFGIAQPDGPPDQQLLRTLAFGVLPTIIFFSALMSVLYHLGLIQIVVRGLAKLMQFSLGTSGAETLAAASNVFVGQTEAPLVVKPYLRNMTESELMALMVGGFSTIAGGVLAVYVSFGVSAAHLMTASVISAPAALVIAKILIPETGTPETAGQSIPNIPPASHNLVEAAAQGTTDGLKLALNVAAMLIAFTALVALADGLIGWCGEQYAWLSGQTAASGEAAASNWSLTGLLGYLFASLAWCLGIPREDLFAAGQLLGLKTVTNEFVAYQQMTGSEAAELTERSKMILTYALCGFANFASIGIQIGGIGALVPERRSDLARISVKAMIGGTLACFMTACIAGVLLG
ncbi:NupC/NupG family nucleoside CNT transporter [bacterium]|nr:NupC/NupG family nucleoside CNT transporter [bacterium]